MRLIGKHAHEDYSLRSEGTFTIHCPGSVRWGTRVPMLSAVNYFQDPRKPLARPVHLLKLRSRFSYKSTLWIKQANIYPVPARRWLSHLHYSLCQVPRNKIYWNVRCCPGKAIACKI